ncbi:MAG: bifunctional UDP-3-O-[3-hydroxymyristoyl] N-acetylglucosamine deacetylase/3-hydroxyacyl-ACP dehydratase [Prevotellaceae bacterium]|jgi:UDP-3-O-[3-hydroxymyristoyl] N-acetylglucosamine deacetylase/3-hydroxyacyl-[acyl-carrier-protein] dehydratase|nr:bifunctional UDP-3-O-[3-hydroxymyristoyl] N-acetylglucosamine deacetylase/3-hydroxyacyl-ACP dehydratase [Prevotellaceae bacterium]
MSKQQTLKKPFSLSGRGLHTGLDINITFHPAPVGTGIIIKRTDLPNEPVIPALAEYVTGATRGTVLQKGDAQVSTVEHALAALYGMGIDNCIIETDAPEFPILDGSAKYYALKVAEVGIEEQEFEKDYFVVTRKIEFQLEGTQSTITLLPDSDFTVQTLIGYDSPVLSNQFAMFRSSEDFTEQIAPCRTFVFVREIEELLKQNLIKGGDLTNAVVIYDRQLPQSSLQHIAELMNQPCPENTSLGYINTDLLFNNEPARHKLLDVIGDLALIGRPIKGHVIATFPGHALNTAFARQLRKEIKLQEVCAPFYSSDAKPVLDINRIKELLPHRYPFLLVDKVMEIGDNYVCAIKNITYNEMQFLGHFPNEPVMPGVLQVEAIAQTVGLLVLSQLEDPSDYSTYLLKIDGVRFRHKVVPGDTMVMRATLLTPIRRGIAMIKGYAFVNGKIASEAEMTAQIIKRN